MDGVDVWPLLTAAARPSATAAHPTLWLSREVMLVGEFKLIVAQPDPKMMAAGSVETGWKYPNGTWVPSDDAVFGCNKYKDRSSFEPCLFDVVSDAREEHNLAAVQPERLRSMWSLLNSTLLTAYLARSPAAHLGNCNSTCANERWRSLGATQVTADEAGEWVETASEIGPICGVPGCGSAR